MKPRHTVVNPEARELIQGVKDRLKNRLRRQTATEPRFTPDGRRIITNPEVARQMRELQDDLRNRRLARDKPVKFYYYEGRHGEQELLECTPAAWEWLLERMQEDNRVTFEEAERDGFEVYGSYEEGHLSMDDGGSIDTLELRKL